MKTKSASILNNFENILSVVQKPCKSIGNLLEIQFLDVSTRKTIFKLPNSSSTIHFPFHSSSFVEILEQFIDQSANLNIVMEHFHSDLISEIGKRVKEHTFFTEKEIWKLLVTSIIGLSELHLRGRAYGNLDLSSFVLIENEEVFDFKLISPEIVMVASKQKQNKSQTYYSFEELNYLKNGQQQRINEENTENDIFHLGLVLLEMATFISVSSCYNLENLTINQKILHKKIEIVENRYSKELCFLIKILLNIDKKKRPTIQELAILIKKFELLDGFTKPDLKNFIQKNLKTNICGKCVQNIRQKQDDLLNLSEQNSSVDESRKLYNENEKEWLNLQKSIGKNRSVLKSLDNHQY